MYCGTLKVQGSDAIVSLLSLSNYYGIESLKEACGTILGENLSDENVFSLLEICEKLECQSLRKLCAEYLAGNFFVLLITNLMKITLMNFYNPPKLWN